MHLIAGLGNPGTAYQNNRHNIGFKAADAIVRRFALQGPRDKFKSAVFEGRIGTDKVLVLKPQTFMNDSGQAIGEAVRFYKLDAQDVTIVYDELDLAPLKVKARIGGGAAGHNGIRSTAQHIGEGFQRVRIGIGHPGHKDRVTPYVLGDFAKAEAPDFETLVDDLAAVTQWLVAGDLSHFMTELALVRGAGGERSERGQAAAAAATPASAPAAPAAPKDTGQTGGPMAAALSALKKTFTAKDD